MQSKVVLLAIVSLILVACGQKQLPAGEYAAWVENAGHGLSQEKEFDGIQYQVLYKPVDYVLAKELSSGALQPANVEARRKELGNLQYLTLRIKSKESNELMSAGISNENEYYQRLEYFMGGIQDDIYLVEEKDTIPCTLCHFERNYGLAPYNNFVLAFAPGTHKEADKIFVYDDKLLGTGKVMLKFSSADIAGAPKLKY